MKLASFETSQVTIEFGTHLHPTFVDEVNNQGI